VDELVNTAAKQLSTANSFVTSKAKLWTIYRIGSRITLKSYIYPHSPLMSELQLGAVSKPGDVERVKPRGIRLSIGSSSSVV